MITRPPGRTTRPISARPAWASAQWCIERVLTTTVEGTVLEGQRGGVGDEIAAATAGGSLDHRGIEIDACRVETALGEPAGEVPRTAPDVEDRRAGWCRRADVAGDAVVERSKEPAREPVVRRSVADEHATCDGVAQRPRAPVEQQRCCRNRGKRERELQEGSHGHSTPATPSAQASISRCRAGSS